MLPAYTTVGGAIWTQEIRTLLQAPLAGFRPFSNVVGAMTQTFLRAMLHTQPLSCGVLGEESTTRHNWSAGWPFSFLHILSPPCLTQMHIQSTRREVQAFHFLAFYWSIAGNIPLQQSLGRTTVSKFCPFLQLRRDIIYKHYTWPQKASGIPMGAMAGTLHSLASWTLLQPSHLYS